MIALCSVKLPFQLDMESAINVLVTQFKTYAAKDGSSHTLSKEEFQTLVASQLPNLVKVRSSVLLIWLVVVACSFSISNILYLTIFIMYVAGNS